MFMVKSATKRQRRPRRLFPAPTTRPGRRAMVEPGRWGQLKVEPAKSYEGPVAPAPLECPLPPRQALAAAATGDAPVSQEALQGLLAEILMETDDRRRVCTQRADQLLEMIFEPGQPVDPQVTLALVDRLQRIAHTLHTEEIRTAELAARLCRTAPPTVQVRAAQLNLAASQQVVGTIDLGERGGR